MGSSDKVDKASKVDKKIKDKSDKKDKKDKKRSESDGIRKETKDKKKDKAKKEKLTAALDAHLAAQEAAVDTPAASSPKKDKTTRTEEEVPAADQELVYFAYPLADEKVEQKKVYKLIKKSNKMKALYRGTKEVEKAIKKCPISAPAKGAPPAGIVIIAGDIFPVEVIEHFPMLCEEHHIPYLFVRSRLSLGEAAGTKRATSVIMLKREPKKAATGGVSDNDKEKTEEYNYMYDSLAEWAQKEWVKQVQPWVSGNHPTLLAMQAAERIA